MAGDPTCAAAAKTAACKTAWRKVPALRGVQPSVRTVGDQRVYSFRKAVRVAPGGPSITQSAKVTVSAEGRVLKVVVGR